MSCPFQSDNDGNRQDLYDYWAEYSEIQFQPNVYQTFLHKFGRWLLRARFASYAGRSGELNAGVRSEVAPLVGYDRLD